MTKVLRAMRMRWVGHLARMEDDAPAKQVFMGEPMKTPPRTPGQEMDVIQADVSSTGLRNARGWMDVAEGSQQWGRLVVAARDHRGPAPANCENLNSLMFK